MKKNARIYVAGHCGMVGSAILRKLRDKGYNNIIVRTSKELDLRRQTEVETFFDSERPEYVFLAAAKVGGILANSTEKAAFYYDNIMIAVNVIHAAYKYGVERLLNLGSSCIYPRMAQQPLKEEYLLTGALEQTNDAYAIAKISAIKMCQYYNEQYNARYFSAIPCNLYGYNDNFDLESSHVLPAMIRKIHEAKECGGPVYLWGDGSPLREFLFTDDLAEAIIFLVEEKDRFDLGEIVNVGTGSEISIKDLASLIAEIIGYEGKIIWDTTKPNGTPRKLLDLSKMKSSGWKAKTKLKEGIRLTYNRYIRNPETSHHIS